MRRDATAGETARRTREHPGEHPLRSRDSTDPRFGEESPRAARGDSDDARIVDATDPHYGHAA